MSALAPFPFHRALRDHYKQRTRTWDWFAGQGVKDEQLQAQRTALLKNTYRLDPAAHAEQYALADRAVKALNIDAQVTLYQEQNTTALNAGIFILDREAHIVLSGSLLSLLTGPELLAVLGHELAHYLFQRIDAGGYEVATRIAYAIANDERSESVHVETARLFSLYLELFCDRGALLAAGEPGAALSALIKLHTGLAQVNTDSYIAQAKEAVQASSEGSEGISHPENYIRCLALHRFATEGAASDADTEKLVRGALDINNLDIFRQRELQDLTQRLIAVVMKPRWINSTAMGALVAEYMGEKKRDPEARIDEAMRKAVAETTEGTRSFLAYVLMDIARADAAQEEVPLGHVLEVAAQLDITKEFDAVLRRELKLGARELRTLKEAAVSALAKMKDEGEGAEMSEA